MKAITQKLIAVLLAIIMGICMASAQTKTVKHTVGRGETLASIAQRYGTTNDKIIELNPDAADFIYVGMELTIPIVASTDQSSKIPFSEIPSQNFTLQNNQSHKPENNDKEVKHRGFVVAQYQLGDFRYAKYTSIYGLGLVYPSISHWGALHIGANLNFSINAGIVKDWGCLIDFGPSLRLDITDNIFVNMPVDVRCSVTFPEGSTDTETDWGLQVAPALHLFLTEKLGLFVGPQMTIGFYSGAKLAFGLTAGLSYEF